MSKIRALWDRTVHCVICNKAPTALSLSIISHARAMPACTARVGALGEHQQPSAACNEPIWRSA